jgi:hypothetical protein
LFLQLEVERKHCLGTTTSKALSCWLCFVVWFVFGLRFGCAGRHKQMRVCGLFGKTNWSFSVPFCFLWCEQPKIFSPILSARAPSKLFSLGDELRY